MDKPKIDTRKIPERESLHFANLDEALARANKLADAERAGKLQMLGNWTLGQNFNHLASWVGYSFEGVPLKVPGILRVAMKLFMKNAALHKPMPAGSRIPGVEGGTLGAEPISTDDGLAKLTTNYDRLKAGPPTIPHLLFGPLTHQEWIDQHLRHAELHLSFGKVNGQIEAGGK